jgi:transglutaminase-like putative cysteine protease
MNRARLTYIALLILMLAVPIGSLYYKLYVVQLPLQSLIPDVSYKVDTLFEVDGYGNNINIATFLPKNDSRQRIFDEQNSGGVFNLEIVTEGLNRVARWQADNVNGHQYLSYTYHVRARHVRYDISPELIIPQSYPAGLDVYLHAEEGIQVDDPLIENVLYQRLGLPRNSELKVLPALQAIHNYLQNKLENRNFSGFTDALTALKLGEASCNGKSRAFVALARKLNLPARLVGGLVMTTGSKRTSHQWVEVFVSGHWVPFDTINNHFAELPENYLALYYGDEVLFKHSGNINFSYVFSTYKRLIPRNEVSEALGDSLFNSVNIYAVFEKVGISQNLLKILLMIPLGALVTVVFRNVIGLETFGTFLPALIAAAARETGLLWGLIGFLSIVLAAAWVRRGLDWLQLLHSPKMAIMLTVVVIIMLAMTVTGVNYGLFDLAHVSLFPIAILAITAERFALTEIEQGSKKVWSMTVMTMVVISAAYVVMDSLFLQSLIMALPEMLLVVIALNLWLGKWVGLRLMEFIRFRKLIFGREVQSS